MENRQCDRGAECPRTPVAFLPMPKKDGARDIHVCRFHARQAEANLFLVEYYDGTDNSESLDAAIKAKHLRVRGSQELLYKPRPRYTEDVTVLAGGVA